MPSAEKNQLSRNLEMNKNYHNLTIWQKGIELTLKIYESTRDFPDVEKYGLISQMRRAAVSVPSNIAEGYGRFNTKEFIQYLRIAKGSLCELDSQLIISEKLNFINNKQFEDLSQMTDNLLNMIVGFIHGCEKNKK